MELPYQIPLSVPGVLNLGPEIEVPILFEKGGRHEIPGDTGVR